MVLPLTTLAVILSLASGPARLDASQVSRGPAMPAPTETAVRPASQIDVAAALPAAGQVAEAGRPQGPARPEPLAVRAGEPVPESGPSGGQGADPAAALPAGEPLPAETGAAAPGSEPSVVTGPERAEILRDAARALAAVTTAKGRFRQVAPDYSVSEGAFYLRRPGRVRFEYDDPVPILIVADGATVAIEDRDLETQDRVPLRTTPLSLLLDDTLDFETRANILNVRQAGGQIAIAMADRSGETEGVLELILDGATYALQAWRTEDAAGGVTTVTLQDVETGAQLSPRLFRIEDIRGEDERD